LDCNFAWYAASNTVLPVIRVSTQKGKARTVVSIDGRLVPADLGEIRRVRRSIRGRVVLKLGGLDACTNDGIAFLQDWLNAGAQLGNATPFLRLVLKNAE
jgi:hypothetical protein